MGPRSGVVRWVLAGLFAALPSDRVQASEPGPTKAFGADLSITTVLSPAYASGNSYVDDQFAYRSASQPTILRAGVDLPTGVQLVSVEWEVCDFEPASSLQLALKRCVRATPPTDPGACLILAVVNSNSTGCYAEFSNVLIGTTVDNDSSVYVLEVVDPDALVNTSFRSVRLRWRRQVSPAPAIATFSDVPASHFAFRYVEALTRAGITGGCGGGEFCPDRPLTRAEMAVFLAVSLGLHWPN